MAAAVAWKKRNLAAGEFAEHVVVGRAAERGFDIGLFGLFEAGHLVETAAADDSDFCFHFVGS